MWTAETVAHDLGNACSNGYHAPNPLDLKQGYGAKDAGQCEMAMQRLEHGGRQGARFDSLCRPFCRLSRPDGTGAGG